MGRRSIDIESARPQYLNGLSYLCFALAKDILTGIRTVVLGELADPSLLSPRNFMVVSLAMFIRAYGLSAATQVTLNSRHTEVQW